jgi:hypothetical protein
VPHSIPGVTAPSHTAPVQTGPSSNIAPHYSNPAGPVPNRAGTSAPAAGLPRFIPVPQAGTPFGQWFDNGATLWNILVRPEQPAPQNSVAPNNSHGGCAPVRPQCG